MSEIRKEFEKALTDKFWPGGNYTKLSNMDISDVVDEVALFSAKWMADWFSTTDSGFPASDDDLISVGFIRRRAKELDHE